MPACFLSYFRAWWRWTPFCVFILDEVRAEVHFSLTRSQCLSKMCDIRTGKHSLVLTSKSVQSRCQHAFSCFLVLYSSMAMLNSFLCVCSWLSRQRSFRKFMDSGPPCWFVLGATKNCMFEKLSGHVCMWIWGWRSVLHSFLSFWFEVFEQWKCSLCWTVPELEVQIRKSIATC